MAVYYLTFSLLGLTNSFASNTEKKLDAPNDSMAVKELEKPDEKAVKTRKMIYDLARKGVVIINTKSYANASYDSYGNDARWAGSGFIVDKEKGIIATNKHVAGELSVSTYSIEFHDGSVADATLIYFDPYHDFAFLRVEPTKIPSTCISLSFAKEPIKINETIFSVGNSAGDKFSVGKGTVFDIYSTFDAFCEQSFCYSGISCGGSSGSPVFNENGEVVGIIYAGKFVSSCAIDVRYITRAFEDIKNGKNPVRKSTGLIFEYANIDDFVEVGAVDKTFATEYINKFPDAHKKVLVVKNSIIESPASRVFIPGDVIWKINDKLIGPNLYEIDKLTDASDGKITFEVFRDGKIVKFDVETYTINQSPCYNMVSFAGCIWYENTELTKFLFGEKNSGLFIKIPNQTSPFKDISKRDGWFFGSNRPLRITSIDNKIVNSLKDLKEVIPNLMKKKTFEIRYIDYLGRTLWGDTVSADRQERYAILKYESEFDSPKIYQFNGTKWETSSIISNAENVTNP